MADDNRRDNNRSLALKPGSDTEKELVKTLVELNNTVSNISKIIQQLHGRILKESNNNSKAITERTLH